MFLSLYFFWVPSVFRILIPMSKQYFLPSGFWAFNSDIMYSCLPFYFYAFVYSFFNVRSVCFCLSMILIHPGGILPLGQSLGELYPHEESCHLAV